MLYPIFHACAAGPCGAGGCRERGEHYLLADGRALILCLGHAAWLGCCPGCGEQVGQAIAVDSATGVCAQCQLAVKEMTQ